MKSSLCSRNKLHHGPEDDYFYLLQHKNHESTLTYSCSSSTLTFLSFMLRYLQRKIMYRAANIRQMIANAEITKIKYRLICYCSGSFGGSCIDC
jgi:hypothetical protein